MSTLTYALRARTFRSLRRHHNYRLFFAGQIVSLAGSWMQNVALVQLAAPDHLRGRLVALYLFAFVGLAPLGSLLAGTLVELGGTRLAFVVAGAVGLAATALATTAGHGRRPLERGTAG